MNPKVSIIIPCYNQGIYLDCAINSVLEQTFRNYEIIIVNDGSDDAETLAILNSVAHEKIKIIHTENQGLPAARNNGIAASKGEYILPLDSDDKIGRTYVEKAVAILDNNGDIGIVYCKAKFFGDENRRWVIPEYSLEKILAINVIFCSAFFRKSDWAAVGGFNSNMIYGWEDWDFWLSLIGLGRSVYMIPEILFYYRKKVSSMITDLKNNKIKQLKMFLQVFSNHRDFYYNNFNSLIAGLLNQIDEFIISNFYIDTGAAFDNNNIIKNVINRSEKKINLEYDLTDFSTIKSLRFNPVKNKLCRFKINEVIFGSTGNRYSFKKNIIPSNGIFEKDGFIYFHSFDPQIKISMPKNIDKIEKVIINGELEILSIINFIIEKLFTNSEKVINVVELNKPIKNTIVYKIFRKLRIINDCQLYNNN